MLCFSFGSAMRPTPLSMAVTACVALAIADTVGPNRMKDAADTMGVPLSVLSEGLRPSGEVIDKHLSLQRLTNLGPEFLLHLCKRVMRHLGGVALSADEVALLRGASALGVAHVNTLTERRQEVM